MNKRRFVLFLIAATYAAGVLAEGTVFLEQFSLAEDRSVPLKQLIPGTEDYYYFHCLHYQHKGDFAKVHETLEQWIERYGYTRRVKEIRNRQALLEYDEDSESSLEHIKKTLDLLFDHQQQDPARATDHPTSLDQSLIDRETLKQRAFSDHDNLQGFQNSALERLVKEELNPVQRRDLLARLPRPDVPGLAKLVVADLKHEHSGGFGSHVIHRRMLLAQLDECMELMPELISNTKFINTYLAKLRPSPDIDWEHDLDAKEAYFTRMWDFVQRMPASRNSLKAHVLFHRLSLDSRRGIYDRQRFMEYVKLPRDVYYINEVYLTDPARSGSRADLNADFETHTMLVSVRKDEPLVRRCLEHFLKEADSYEEYLPYFEHDYLKELFAETKVLNGIGDMEQWYSLLPPDKYKALKGRVELEFLPTNNEVMAVKDPVVLRLALKNVPTLIIRTFEINTANFYRENDTELDTNVDLDGLVANKERIVSYDQVPLRRHVEEFEFPDIDKPGAFVVEFIGNGQSSRALIQKGRLTFTQRIGSAGHVFTIYDEDNRKLDDARLWLAGHEYEADKNGEIVVPFSNKPVSQKIIISHGDFSALHWFKHESESYSFKANIHIDREALVEGQMCKILVRPELCLNSKPVDIGLLEDVWLTIQAIDQDGINSSENIENFALHNDRESVYEFKVPERLSNVIVSLKGDVENLSWNEKQALSDSSSLTVNRIDITDGTECLHLRHVEGKYILVLLGKTGEVKARRPVHLELRNGDFTKSVSTVLQTDERGEVALGPLHDIDRISARVPEGIVRHWRPVEELHSYANVVHGLAGASISIPFMGSVPEDKREAVSLLEVRDCTFVRDCLDNVSFKEGFLVIKDLPAGDYDLLIKENHKQIHLRLTDGRREGTVLLSRDRHLKSRNTQPLQIVSVDADDKEKKVRIQLANASASARVHVIATRFMPFRWVFQQIGSRDSGGLFAADLTRATSHYDSGRSIGDEYQYILERKYASRFPGNMLKRPSLLVNPWSLREADTGIADSPAIMRGVYGSRSPGSRGSLRGRYGGSSSSASGDYANLNFLPTGSLVLSNLAPDADGVVTVDTASIGSRQQLHVVALDGLNTVYREISLATAPEKCRDLRLAQSMDPAKHYTEHRSISALNKGGELVIDDLSTSRFEIYDSLSAIHGLFVTLTRNVRLAEFSFVLHWPDMEMEKKQGLYSRYACHELNFFLFKKDPDFFKSTILPLLANKKDKTFMDHWLLGSDLSPYTEHWSYVGLNTVERILLVQRIPAEHAMTLRSIKDCCDRVIPDTEEQNGLFDTALKGSMLAKDTHYRYLPTFAAVPDLEDEPSVELSLDDDRVVVPAEMEELAAPDTMMSEFDADGERRREVRQFYRKMAATEEWVENNYYGLPIEDQSESLVGINSFWRDYAACTGDQDFVSTHVAEASLNFTEMMFALSVLDLPFKAAEHDIKTAGQGMKLLPGNAAIVFHKQIKEAGRADKVLPILISQNFFALNDRYTHRNNERYDKFVTGEFQAGRVYGCQVILTNPTSSRRKVSVLLQIPEGAVPVRKGLCTRSLHRKLMPYSTDAIEYYFYFPSAGAFAHYPVHVAEKEEVIAFADALTFNVVDVLTEMDRSSWQYVSQNGSGADVVKYLDDHNIGRLDLDLIAFRMRDADTFRQVINLLRARHEYSDTLWSYGLYHNDVTAIRDYLQYSPFAEACGVAIDSALLTLDPVARHDYQHKEYHPLVNARVGLVVKKPRILNVDLSRQYRQLLEYLRYRAELDSEDLLAVAYYMFLQDRVEEGLAFFDRIKPEEITERLQYDYLKAYVAFYRERPDEARGIAAAYRDYPVNRWRDLFRSVLAQVEEAQGGRAKVVDEEDRAQVQTGLADTDTSLDFKIEDRKIVIQSQNLEVCRVNYYLIDIEFLFSRDPFVQDISGQFSIVQPNESDEVKLSKRGKSVSFDLPKKFRNSNIVVELVGGGMTRRQAYYPHSLGVQIMEKYGQLRITREGAGDPLSKAYIKVYARTNNGETSFYKDGYTDLRGRFDYASLSTDQIYAVDRFSILVISEKDGAVVREVDPPKM
jgi:hypothetical protein